jgi:hypothetical protein
MDQQEAARRFNQRQRCSSMVKLPLQLGKFRCHLLYFKDDRSNQRKVARAMPADERLILDRFNAKWTFHILSKPEPTATRPKSCLCIAEFGAQQVALERKYPMLGRQRCGNDDVTLTGPADDRLLVIRLETKRTKHEISFCYRVIFKVKTLLLALPSESVTSIRI